MVFQGLQKLKFRPVASPEVSGVVEDVGHEAGECKGSVDYECRSEHVIE